jgi:hypothetical protein
MGFSNVDIHFLNCNILPLYLSLLHSNLRFIIESFLGICHYLAMKSLKAQHDLNPNLKFEKCLHFVKVIQFIYQHFIFDQWIESAFLLESGMNNEVLQVENCISCNLKFIFKFYFSFCFWIFQFKFMFHFNLHLFFLLLDQLIYFRYSLTYFWWKILKNYN